VKSLVAAFESEISRDVILDEQALIAKVHQLQE
jgi:hypothetical protein